MENINGKSRFLPQTLHCVYVCMEAGTGRLKIGISKNVKLRLMQLQTGNANAIDLWFVIPFWRREDAENVESYLHRLFSQYRVGGEWFDLPAAAQHHLFMLAEITHWSTEACIPALRNTHRTKSGLGLEHLDYLIKHETRRHTLLVLGMILCDLLSLGEYMKATTLAALAATLARDWGMK